MGKATAALLAAATLASGAAFTTPTAMAEGAPDAGVTQEEQTVRQKLEDQLVSARAKEGIQDHAAGKAYTADTYAPLLKAINDAQAALDTADVTDETLQSALDTLKAAEANLKVATWTVNKVELSGDATLTGNVTGLTAKPETVTAVGSDGSNVALTLGQATETHPALGVTAGTMSVTAEAEGTRPAINATISWTVGSEIKAYGHSFTLGQDGVWTLTHDAGLGLNNQPTESAIDENGLKATIEWGQPTAANGQVTMKGAAKGSIDGQNWRIDYTATREVTHGRLDEAIKNAKAKLNDKTVDYTNASRRTVKAAIANGEKLGDTATAEQYEQASRAIDQAADALVAVTWTANVNGAQMPLTRDKDGNWSLVTGTLDQAIQLDNGTLRITSNDPTLGDNGAIILSTTGGASEDVNDPTKDSRIGFGQWVNNGGTTLQADENGRRYKVDASWSELKGTRVTDALGAAFEWDNDSLTWKARPAAPLDSKGEPAVTSITLDNGEQTVVGLEYGKASGSTSGTLKRVAVAKGELKGSGQKYEITVTATTDTAASREALASMVDSASKRFQPGAHHWTHATADAYQKAIEQAAVVLNADDATPDRIAAAAKDLNKAVEGLKAQVWSLEDGTKLEWNEADDSYRVDAKALKERPADQVKATNLDGETITLNRSDNPSQAHYTDTALGATVAAGRAVWSGETIDGKRPVTVTSDFDYEAGSPLSVKGGEGETLTFKQVSNVWTANTTTRLDKSNNAAMDTVTVAGAKAKVEWSRDTTTTSTQTATTITRTGRAEGVITVDGHQQRWAVNVTASRTEGRVASLNVIEMLSDGKQRVHQVIGFNENRSSYEITLDAAAASNQFTLGYASASDDNEVTLGEAIAPEVGADASRILKVSLNGRVYTVTVKFEKAATVTDNQSARLTGIYVNRSGKPVKGDLIDGWNPDVLTYTIRLGEHDPNVYVLPEAPDGVTVKAGSRREFGYSVEQSWIVTAANGQTRTYTVRMVRDHASKPTADESFTPNKPVEQDPAPTTSSTVADPAAVGWKLDGKFTAAKSNKFTVPEGGTFSYQLYAGQNVQVQTMRTGAMTWQYTLTVVAPDGRTTAEHTYTVTYITAATHKAELEGILIDNTRLNGFRADRYHYAALVANIDHWTVSAAFDRTTGMSVTIHKEKAKATLTVVSADGLVTRAYTVDIRQKEEKAGEGTDGAAGVPKLAETGSPSAMAALAAGIFALTAAGLSALRRRPRHRAL